jgi:hypothetical protein
VEKDETENSVASHCSVAYWDEVWQVIEAINESPSDVRFLDGQQMTGHEGWRAALMRVRSRLAELRAKSPKNLMVCKQLPWTCGECGTDSVNSLRLADNGDLVATCDKCGTEWV